MSTKAESTIRRELRRVEQVLADLPSARRLTDGEREAEQYGAMTALAWVLGHDTCAPHKLAEPSEGPSA